MLLILIFSKPYGAKRMLGGLLLNHWANLEVFSPCGMKARLWFLKFSREVILCPSNVQPFVRRFVWITNVYGPTNYRERRFLWPELSSLSDYRVEPWYLGGDFNITRQAQERFPLGRVTKGMRKFNNFISVVNLLEIPLSNGRFTWCREGVVISRSLIEYFLSPIIGMRCLKTLE